MSGCKPALVLLLLFSGIYAVDVPANFDGSISEYYMNTNLRFTTDLTLSTDPDYVIDGNAANLQNGDTVCSGATITASPTYSSKWAVSSLDVSGGYPVCGDEPCSGMTSYSTVNTNRDIKWLSSTVFDDQNEKGDGAPGFSHDPANYDALGTFETQRVTYAVTTTSSYPNKRGQVNVFCKGTLSLLDGSTNKGGGPWSMPKSFSTLPSFTVTTTGNHDIKTKLSGVQCIGAMAKYPLNLDDPSLFWLTYFTRNQPSVGESTKTITINVESGTATCDMYETAVESNGPVSGGIISITVAMRNNATNSIKVTGVSSTKPSYIVAPFTEALCDALGLPDSWCPDSPTGGFNETIAAGATKDLDILLLAGPSASGGTNLTFSAVSTGTACGSPVSCTENVPLSGPMSCSISPSSTSMATNVSKEFTVACRDLANDSIACTGSGWSWNSLYGGFDEADNTHAVAYTTSTSGTGTLSYESSTGLAECHAHVTVLKPTYCEIEPSAMDLGSGMGMDFTVSCTDQNHDDIDCIGSNWFCADGLDCDVWDATNEGASISTTSPVGATGTVRYSSIDAQCHSDITVITPPYECELVPVSVELNYSESQHFTLTCWENGTVTTPDSTDYELLDPLDGSLSGESDTGVTYTAPGDDSEGDLLSVAHFGIFFVPVTSHIKVGNGTPPDDCDPEIDPDCDNDDDGSSEWCTIGGHGILSVYPGYSGWVGIKCGPDANEDCDGVDWAMKPPEPELGLLFGSDDNGTYFTITGDAGNTVRIYAYIGGNSDHDCFKILNILEPECWAFS